MKFVDDDDGDDGPHSLLKTVLCHAKMNSECKSLLELIMITLSSFEYAFMCHSSLTLLLLDLYQRAYRLFDLYSAISRVIRHILRQYKVRYKIR